MNGHRYRFGFVERRFWKGKMKKLIGLLILVIIAMSLVACGGGDDDEDDANDQLGEQIAEQMGDLSDDQKEMLEDMQQQMEEAQEAMEDIDAKSAVELALPEALKWDSAARVYQVDTDKALLPDGTSSMWRVYFAVREDSPDTPSDQHGKKFFVMVMDGKIIDMEAWETPDEISSRAECYLFVPDDWMNSDDAYTQCIEALEGIYGADVDTGVVSHMSCYGGAEYYLEGPSGRQWETIPTWVLSYKIGDTYARAEIHSVTGEVLELK